MNDSVLYIEDDESQAKLLRICLERSGYAVDLAADGETGLDACRIKTYDAVIVDQSMPGMSGLDVIRELASRGRMPPTIVVTGSGNEQIAVEAMKLGVSDYLVKDMEGGFMHVLPLIVRRAIEQRRLVDDKKRMEMELAQAQRMQSIGQLASGIAHEINTPTQYIGDNARFLQNAFAEVSGLLDDFNRLLQAAWTDELTDEMLREMEAKFRRADIGYLAKEIPQAIQQSLEGVEHVAAIVGAMREFSFPNNGEKQAVDLNHLIEGAVTICQSEWRCVADVVFNLDPKLPPVCCLPTDIHRVVMNLVVNAAQAIADAAHDAPDEKGTITIRTRFDYPDAEIRVADTGPGIPEDIRLRVFDLFFTTKEVGRGTGQGLALAHTIVVDKHGGMIRFESEVGRGTTFVVRLPLDGLPEPALEVEENEKILEAV